MIKNPTVPTIVTPRGLDIALNEVNSALLTKLTWLNLAFGKVEVLNRVTDKPYRNLSGTLLRGAIGKGLYLSFT